MILDTHKLAWWLGDAPRLTSAARQRIADPRTAVSVSAVSVFEIETKRRLGKLHAPADVVADAKRSGFTLLDLSATAAAVAGALDWDHPDPFDRLLVAQAREIGRPLLNADAQILAFEQLATPG